MTNRGSFIWGIKRTFREYFDSLSDHVYSVEDGAHHRPDGSFTFEIEPGSDWNQYIKCRGKVRLTGHTGALNIQIANPIVRFREDGSAIVSAEVDEFEGSPVRMEIVELSKASGDFPKRFEASLLKEGSYMFFGKYFEGEEMDPVLIQPVL